LQLSFWKSRRSKLKKKTVIFFLAIMFLMNTILPLNVSNAEITWTAPVILDSNGDVGIFCYLALDSNDNLHISYYDDTNEDLKYIRMDNGVWEAPETIDSTGRVGWSCSLALDSNDNPHIFYLSITNGDLKYIRMDNGVWEAPVTVDSSGNIGENYCLALDSNDNPHISYHDTANDDLRYIRMDNGVWEAPVTVDSAATPCGFSSLALDSNNNPHICYLDRTNYALKHIRMDNGVWEAPVTVDSTVDSYIWCSLALDSNDNPHISYYDMTHELKYVRMDNGVWEVPVTVDSTGEVGYACSLALDSNDNPHISYRDFSNDNLKYVRMDNGVWEAPVTVDSTGNVGGFPSLALDSNDDPHISYYDGANDALKYVSGQYSYDARISAWSVPGWAVLSITMDGVDTGFSTPHTFEGLTGTHTFTLPETANNYSFARWTKEGLTVATTNTITVDSDGIYTAQYTIEHLYFEVPYEEEVYVVETYSNSSVSDLSFNADLLRIQFSVDGADEQGGFCNVTVPVELLLGDFSVFVDDVELIEDGDFTVMSNGTHSTLSINYEHGVQVISVVEVFGIPDFAGWLFLPFAMSATLLILILRKKAQETGKTSLK
jgi:hypothetical protein